MNIYYPENNDTSVILVPVLSVTSITLVSILTCNHFLPKNCSNLT